MATRRLRRVQVTTEKPGVAVEGYWVRIGQPTIALSDITGPALPR